jgi:hypothetical protein
MSEPASPTPQQRTDEETVDPPQMSLAEKLACEWEARHDVSARGRIASMAPLQEYLTHARASDTLHATPRPPHHQRETERSGGTVPSGLRGWLRWGEEGPGSSGSVIPRGC